MKVWDCFPFNNELDVLEVRLHELDPVVDRFVIVEADRTHTNSPKPLHFRDNAARFGRFRDKIIHVVVTDAPHDHDPWVRENFQRECIGRGLGGLRDEDLVLICDADEIPRRDVILNLRRRPRDVSGLRMPLYRFRFNFVNVAGSAHVAWGMAVRGSRFRSAQQVRNLRAGFENLYRRGVNGLTALPAIPHAGWHFSWLGDESAVESKLRNYAHAHDASHAGVAAGLNIERMMAERLDLFGGEGGRWEIVRLDGYFPRYVLENQERFAHLIAPGGVAVMDDFRAGMKREASELSNSWNGLMRRIRASE